MPKGICIVSPTGGSGNYIALTLLNKISKPELSYHWQGTHYSTNEQLIRHIHRWNEQHDANLINSSRWLPHEDSIFLQNVIDKKWEFVIINWWEKIYHNAGKSKLRKDGEDWISWQKDLWKNYNHPIVRAILTWTYSYNDCTAPELKRIQNIKNTFQFDSLYTDYLATKKEFEKYDIEYTEKQYNEWRQSQNIIFDSYEAIQTTPIAILEKDYQKAIALSRIGIKDGLNVDECWEKFKHKLD